MKTNVTADNRKSATWKKLNQVCSLKNSTGSTVSVMRWFAAGSRNMVTCQ